MSGTALLCLQGMHAGLGICRPWKVLATAAKELEADFPAGLCTSRHTTTTTLLTKRTLTLRPELGTGMGSLANTHSSTSPNKLVWPRPTQN